MTTRIKSLLIGLLTGTLAAGAAFGDDIDIYAAGSDVSTSRGKPNILFIIDTSGSMTDPASGADPNSIDPPYEFATYDKEITYLGECSDKYHWFTGNAPTSTSLGVDCGSSQKILTGKLHCGLSAGEIADQGFSNPRWYFQWRTSGANTDGDTIYEWQSLTSSPGAPDLPNTPVDCKPDSDGFYVMEDGLLSGTEAEKDPNGAWSSNPDDVDTSSYSKNWYFYTGNYMNWYNNYKNGMNRITAVKHALTVNSTDPTKQGLLRTMSDVSIGFMTFDGAKGTEGGANGGMVIKEIVDLATNQADLIAIVNNLDARGDTPLAESLVEGLRYYMGEKVYFGDMTKVENSSGTLVSSPSVAASRNALDSSSYASPIIKECQMNHIVLLTDGEPTNDGDSDNAAELLPGWSTQGPTGKEWTANCRDGSDDDYPAGSCLDDIAAYGYWNDISSQKGEQNVITHTIGFDISTSELLMKETGRKGNGATMPDGYYSVNNTEGFKSAVQEIVAEVIDMQSSFNAPAVSVNAFNRTRHSNDLYFTLFSPVDAPHWDGNLKKFQIKVINGVAQIVGVDEQPAVDELTGFFKDTAKSFWTPTEELPDGGEANLGGASSVLPLNRRIFTDAGNPGNLTLTEFTDANLLISATDLGVTSEQRSAHIAWIRGEDADDVNGNGITSESRRERNMGDPLHSRPAVVTYGGTASSPDTVIYFGTNDGFLHGIDAATGVERLAFAPKSLWQNFKTLRTNPLATPKVYGIDTPIVPHVKDVDGDGVIESGDGDFVHLYFGLRRGGRHYYALDVTDRSAPKLLWSIDNTTTGFGELGYTFAEPVLGRVILDGYTTATDVLFLSGGFDTGTQDDDTAVSISDTMGRALFVVNTETGELLWRAGPTGSGANLEFSKMTSSIPARPRAIDINGDTLTDRLYVGDLGGRVWRFDVNDVQGDGNNNGLLTGGLIASLGAAHLVTPTLAEHRRFMNTPDVALVNDKKLGRYLTISMGSGERQHPNNKGADSTSNRFYVLKDYNVDSPIANTDYATYYGADGYTHESFGTPVLLDLTGNALDENNPTDLNDAKNSKGWYINLPGDGEKVLAEAVTVKDQLVFTTFTPTESSGSCDPGLGLGRIYSISLKYGIALFDHNEDGVVDLNDRFEDLNLRGIPPALTVLFPEATGGKVMGLVGTEEAPIQLTLDPVKTYWYEVTDE